MRYKSQPRRVPRREPTDSATKEYVQQHNEPCTSSEALIQSNRDIHTEVNPHRCGHYGKTFKCKSKFLVHERTHTREKYQCEFCDKSFSKKSFLSYHKMTHNETSYQCHDCGKSYTTKPNLRRHIIAKHMGHRPYKCDKCTVTFARRYYLTEHTNIHTGKKPYVCEVCDKAFAIKRNLKTHRNIHLGRIMCSVCGKDLKHKRALSRHMRYMNHKNDAVLKNKSQLTME